MRRAIVIICVAVLGMIAFMASLLLFVDYVVKARTTKHVFELDSSPRFLTEAMAVAFARKALAAEGFDTTLWELQPDGRTADPDGRTDKYVSRNSLNPNDVTMIFVNKTERKTRCVNVELQDRRIVCGVTIPK